MLKITFSYMYNWNNICKHADTFATVTCYDHRDITDRGGSRSKSPNAKRDRDRKSQWPSLYWFVTHARRCRVRKSDIICAQVRGVYAASEHASIDKERQRRFGILKTKISSSFSLAKSHAPTHTSSYGSPPVLVISLRLQYVKYWSPITVEAGSFLHTINWIIFASLITIICVTVAMTTLEARFSQVVHRKRASNNSVVLSLSLRCFAHCSSSHSL